MQQLPDFIKLDFSMTTNKIIAIAGASGSGKTTIAKKLQESYQAQGKTVYLISTDNYYRRKSEQTAPNFDHPDSVELDLLVEHLKRFREGNDIELPTYNFVHSDRTDETTRLPYKEDAIIIVEGIFALNHKLITAIPDLKKVYVETPADVSVTRRYLRDEKERDTPLIEGAKYYLETVRPMFAEHVEQTQDSADIKVTNVEADAPYKALDKILHYINSPKAVTKASDKTMATNSSKIEIDMHILHGFAMALGIAAVATAFVMLNVASLGTAGLATILILGTATAAIGAVGFFSKPATQRATDEIAMLDSTVSCA